MYSGLALIGLNSVVINAFTYSKKTHLKFVKEYIKGPSYAKSELKNIEIVKMSIFFNET